MESCVIASGDGIFLQARIFKPPPEKVVQRGTAVVLVHPYSKLGGCQGLMQGIALRLSIKGFISVTFDMRGVGRSSGWSTLTGVNEIQDVVSVCNWVSQHLSVKNILLVGSSAGATIAGSAVEKVEEVKGFASIGYPFGKAASVIFGRHHRAILKSPKPKLFILGTNDEFTSIEQLEKKLRSAVGRVQAHFVVGVGHFEMEGPSYDARMADLIAAFIPSLLDSSSTK
ncbi:alpha/beta-Hydrolases superfamily protein [Euphorbia peplus]|nr:alpha/beta-Hydrolases superfamily protein [Euphorbia peplus]